MKLGKRVAEATVVHSWLAAELHSARFSPAIEIALRRVGADDSLLKAPDLTSKKDNALRRRILFLARGRRGAKKFPWRRVKWWELWLDNQQDIAGLFTPFGDTWLAFTNGERRLDKAAEFIVTLPQANDPLKHVYGIQKQLIARATLEPPILITSDADLTKPIAILEGNVRCVSYYLHKDTRYPLRAYVGIAPDIARWAHSGDTLEDIRQAFRQQGGNE
jgi:hypothetical protein